MRGKVRPVRTFASGGKFCVTDYCKLSHTELMRARAELAAATTPSCVRRARAIVASFRYGWMEALSTAVITHRHG